MLTLPRIQRKKLFVLYSFTLIVLLLLLNFLKFSNTHKFNTPSLIDNHDTLDFNQGFNLSTTHNKPLYKLIDDNYDINEFIKLPLSDKCKIYFDYLYKTSPDWKITKIEKDNTPFDDPELNEFMVNLNVYNSCFMGKNFDSKIFQSFPKIDQKFNPFLSGYFPIFQHWNGELFYGPHLKKIKGYGTKKVLKQLGKADYDYNLDTLINSDSDVKKFAFNEPYWKFYKDNLKGAGISISVSDGFIDPVLLLLSNLRTVGTKLPVQLIHRGDLSTTNRLKLSKVARNDYKNTKCLDIYFVDISLCLNNEYKTTFHGYYNKLLSYTFASFETIILLDADVVLFQKPEDLFKTSQYLETDTLFFKDRNINFQIGTEFLNFIIDRAPSNDDHYMFGINKINEEISKSEYFEHRNFFYMEAGVVVINRLKFWNGIFTTLHLSLFKQLTDSGWGDKELYWLALIFSGLDNYKFNNNWAGAVGKPIKNMDFNSHKICSSHPAHILSDNNKLSWLNSGVLNCKKASNDLAINDFNAITEKKWNIEGMKFESSQDLKEYYESPISFEAAVIPPNSQYSLSEDEVKGTNMKFNGWNELEICLGYIWCAVDTLGDGTKEGTIGQFIIFNEEQIKWYEKVTYNYVNYV